MEDVKKETIKWTEKQQKIIDLRDRNILVSAAAGSGKTAVLVERIISMLTDENKPMDIDKFLIVTFTKAAAAEMKEKINNAIEDKLDKDRENVHLQKQITLINNAQITTIHSFCLDVIRNHFNEIDLDPSFRIGDDAELTLLKSDIVSDLLEKHYASEDEEEKDKFIEFIESYSTGKSDNNMEKLILNIYNLSISFPYPDKWLEKQKTVFEIEKVADIENSNWMKKFLEYIKLVINDCLKNINYALEICENQNGPYMYKEALEDDRANLIYLSRQDSYSGMANKMGEVEFARLSSKKDENVNVGLREKVKGIRDKSKKEISDLKKNYFFQSEEEMIKDLITVKPLMKELIDLTKEFEENYTKMKRENNIVDFNDLEHLALSILLDKEGKRTDAAKELSDYYKEVLIDEYQDSNDVQEAILTSITGEENDISDNLPNMFMVGDVKQSIYKFRLAKPELFMGKYKNYTFEDSKCQKVKLDKNFRSRETVIKPINYIFSQIMIKEFGNIQYSNSEELVYGADFKETNKNISTESELLLITDDGEAINELDKEEQEYTEKEAEAKVIASRIKELMKDEFQVFDKDKKEYRSVEFRDIVILLRTMTNWAEVFTKVLEEEGIKAYSDTQSGYFKSLEVQTVLNFLKIIDNPRQEIPLAAVMYSPIFEFKDEEVAKMKIRYKDMELFDVISNYAGLKEETDIQEKAIKFIETLDYFRKIVPYTSVNDLIQEIYDKTGYLNYVLVLKEGKRKEGNLIMLLQKAIDFEKSAYNGLFQFIRYMEKLNKYEIDYGEAKVSGENENTVKIMSVHKSKGLEFPVVFASGLSKTFNQQDARASFALHSELGIGSDCVDAKLRMKSPTLIKKIIQNEIKLENLHEELRILYVDLTRAKEKLIMTGVVKDLPKGIEKFREANNSDNKELSYSYLSNAKNYLELIAPTLINNKAFDEVLKKYGQEINVESNRYNDEIGIVIKAIGIREIVNDHVKKNIKEVASKEELLKWDVSKIYDESIKNEIKKHISYEYPYKLERVIKSKLTVSELKRMSRLDIEDEPSEHQFENLENFNCESIIPKFANKEKAIKGTDRGTLYHKIMEKINFDLINNIEDVEKELVRLASVKIISENEKEMIKPKKIYNCINSDVGNKMKKAQKEGKLKKEQPFVLGMKANEINKEYESEELVLVQGVIDAFYEDDEGITVIDYKTDYIKDINNGEKELVDKYKTQLLYYKSAIERIREIKVKHCYIYSFNLEKMIEIE